MLLPIENDARDYPWGRRGAISELLGRPETTDLEAELWFGAHHGSPSAIVGEHRTLVDVARDLPLLLKVLAAGAPLSLQAHPDAVQARAGFDRENAVGLVLDAATRNYRDPHPKPELIVALSAFEALSGFRPAAEARAEIAELAGLVGATGVLAPLLDRLVDDERVGEALLWLLGGGGEVDAIVDATQRALAAQPDALPYAARIAGYHPGDPGIVGALLLHHVVLQPGEALYLPAGNIHAYLDGIGIELMAPSDNVLRGGLTSKHIDVGELGRILNRSAGPLPRLEPVALDGGGRLYAPDDPAAGFSLAHLEARASIPLHGPAIALCTAGSFTIRGDESSIEVTRGDAILATRDEGTLRIEGSGSLYLAR